MDRSCLEGKLKFEYNTIEHFCGKRTHTQDYNIKCMKFVELHGELMSYFYDKYLCENKKVIS